LAGIASCRNRKADFAQRDVERPVGHGQVEIHAPVEARDQCGKQVTVHRAYPQRSGTVDALAGEARKQQVHVAVHVYDDFRRRLRRFVQPVSVRHADLDPGLQRARQVAHADRGLVRVGQAFRKSDSLGVLEAIGEQPRQQVLGGLRRVARRPDLERLVDAAIRIRQADLEHVHRCA
jgi:hypothetical protein